MTYYSTHTKKLCIIGSRTLPGRHKDSTTIVTVEDIEGEGIAVDDGDDDADSLEGDSHYKDLPLYRQSTLRLKERMDKQWVYWEKKEEKGDILGVHLQCGRWWRILDAVI